MCGGLVLILIIIVRLLVMWVLLVDVWYILGTNWLVEALELLMVVLRSIYHGWPVPTISIHRRLGLTHSLHIRNFSLALNFIMCFLLHIELILIIELIGSLTRVWLHWTLVCAKLVNIFTFW